ncbi:MAG TPA: hypothetical protein VF982_00355, partial [Anaerolineales bacterium]
MARWKDWLQRGGLETMALLIGPMLLFGPPLLRGQALFWGTPLLQFTPWRHFAFEVLAGGDLPLWNPGLGMGAPLIANYQLAFFYPPSWILALIDIAWGQTLLVMLHLMLAAVGMERLARKVGISRQGAVLAGMAFSMSGYLVARASFLSIIWAAAWLPWLLWAVEVLLARLHPSRVSNRKLIGGVILLAVVLAMQWLSGHAQTSWYSSLLVAAWTIWRGRQLGGRRLSLQLATAVGLAVVLALLVAAIQLLPTGIYLAASQRAGAVDRGLAMAYSFWPWRLIELATPNLFGSPGAGNYWGYAAHWEDALYMGMLPVLMAAGALFWPSERARRWRWFFVPLIGLTFLLALGENTPVFPFLYEHVPTFSLFQAPTRWNVFLVFGFAFLAGLGYDGWAPPQGRWLYWIRLATAGAGVIGLAAWLGSRLLGSVEATFVPALAASGAMLFLVGILSLTRRKPLGFRWRLAMYALVILDLILATATLNPWQELALQQGNASLPQRVDSEHRLYMPL